MTARVGLVVNPAAGRDIRRLTGGASVSNNYAKRRTAECVLAGVGVVEGAEVLAMPDASGIAERILDSAPDGVETGLLDFAPAGGPRDTRRAAERFREAADAVVVLGGDGTNRDAGTSVGDVPLVSVSTGTNNVVPTAVDGTVAGMAAAVVADGAADAKAVSYRHGTAVAEVDGRTGRETVTGLATVGVVDEAFVGTRALLDSESLLGGVASRAAPGEIGVSGAAGAVHRVEPDESGGVGIRFAPAGEASRRVRAVTVPGVVSELGVAECRRLDAEESFAFEVETAVVSADGERELEVRDAEIAVRPADDGPRIVDVDAALAAAAEEGFFVGE
ncbi:NAD(+)/NADH kinase [Halopelagius longus]|uniref:ATP-NAD kinase n=1 Tax=Halopelagius longus TaxID=1236180 RepID=A0A1H1DFH7_9EURY|nr:NAD(+)/NADH kinase [Halopelagius longus]RDI71301.1 ATP-NAD kinase [Halopelagius longus]SDQ74948.1 Predicted polyphosphate-or ATP-dependent NAD kinase [Halopelagius longus]